MSITEIERAEMVSHLSAATNPRTAETLMKCVLPEGRAHLATRADLKEAEHSIRVDFTELRGEFAELRGEFAELKGEFAELRGEFAELRGEFAELKGEFAELKGEFAELRGEFAELKAHFDASLAEQRAQVESTLAKQFRVSMLVLAGFMVPTWTAILTQTVM